MSFVVDFVLLGGTNLVLVIWGHLGINTVFRFFVKYYLVLKQ